MSVWQRCAPCPRLHQTANPVTPDEFLSAKIRWAVHDVSDDFQSRYALEMITAFVNKRDKGESRRKLEVCIVC